MKGLGRVYCYLGYTGHAPNYFVEHFPWLSPRQSQLSILYGARFMKSITARTNPGWFFLKCYLVTGRERYPQGSNLLRGHLHPANLSTEVFLGMAGN